MARKMKDDAKPAAKAGHNGYDPKVLSSVVARIENVFETIRSEQGTFMARCKSLRTDIGEIYEEAKARGIPTKALRKVIKTRDLERKMEELREDLDLVDRDSYDAIRMSLGDLADLPLGQAATKGAPGAPAKDDKDLRPAFLKGSVTEDQASKIAAANSKLLKDGIRPVDDGPAAA